MELKSFLRYLIEFLTLKNSQIKRIISLKILRQKEEIQLSLEETISIFAKQSL